VHYWVLDPNVPGLVGRMDLDATWWAMAMGVDEESGTKNVQKLIRTLIGDAHDDVDVDDDVDIEVVSTDPWVARMLNATTYRTGRVFLVGDAAHLNPPWGGHGFNTAVGDAVNIGWKISAVLHGWAGPDLLNSYQEERRPIAQQTIDLATHNMSNLSTNFADPRLADPGTEGDRIRSEVAAHIQTSKYAEFHSLDLVLGYSYDNSSVIVADGRPLTTQEPSVYVPTAQPGSRLPHLWLPDGRSVFDLLGTDMSLIILDPGDDSEPFRLAAKALSIPLTIIDLAALGCPTAALQTLYQATMLLVRPDQHVAWRTTASAVEVDIATEVLRQITATNHRTADVT
jgi:hypothetical protein